MDIIKCPLCGKEFTKEEAKDACSFSCSGGCNSCGMISCPNCGYKIPGEPDFLKAIADFFSGKKPEKENK